MDAEADLETQKMLLGHKKAPVGTWMLEQSFKIYKLFVLARRAYKIKRIEVQFKIESDSLVVHKFIRC